MRRWVYSTYQEFQRKYVWRASKVAELVDSLWRGYPIGTLLLWESSYESAQTALAARGKTGCFQAAMESI